MYNERLNINTSITQTSVNVSPTITQTSLSLSPAIGSSLTTWGSITGVLSNQTDLYNVLSGKISLTDLSSTATGLTYNNTTGVFSLTSGYTIPLSATLATFITKDVDNLTYYTKTSDLPAVNNGLLTIKKNNTSIGTFSANQSTNESINIEVPTKTSDLTNDGDGNSNFATESYVDTHGGKIDKIQKNGTDLPIVNKTVNIPIPTKTSDLTNNSGFINKDVNNLTNYTTTSDMNTALNNKVTKNLDITGGTKCKITYDSKGLVTGGSDLTESDIPYIHLSKVIDVIASSTEVNYLDGTTSNIQNQLNQKQPNLTNVNAGTGISITGSGANVVISNTQTSAEWGNITGNIQDQTDLQTEFETKQATLVSGTNIKTINNQSILGSGNIEIQGGGGGIPNLDGGTATSVYTIDQVVDGGSASENVA